MLLALPFVTFLCFFFILRELGFDWRRTVLAAAVFEGTSVVVVIITREGLAHAIYRP
jgi:hypothetical protein